jgi:type IV secretion system protein TrbL
MNIDPGTITLIQTTFLQQLTGVFTTVTHYALNLLYIFAALELVIFGIAWALQQGIAWERLFFKVLKIGLIFFLIQNYAYLLNTILQSFVNVGGIVAHTKHLTGFVFNPAKIWRYGYDIGLNLLKIASLSSSIGLSLIQITLGMGILLSFGLLGIQIILQVVGFYLVSLTALILLPFGAFNPSADMFSQSVKAVFKAGVRVMVLIMVLGIAVTIWSGLHLGKMAVSPDININQILGLFFSALLFLYLAIRLPQIVSEVIGKIHIRSPEKETAPAAQVISSPAPTSAAAAPISGAAAMQAATNIEAGTTMQPGFGTATTQAAQLVTACPVTVTPAAAAQAAGGINQAGSLQKSISHLERSTDMSLKKLKKSFLKALSEKSNAANQK